MKAFEVKEQLRQLFYQLKNQPDEELSKEFVQKFLSNHLSTPNYVDLYAENFWAEVKLILCFHLGYGTLPKVRKARPKDRRNIGG